MSHKERLYDLALDMLCVAGFDGYFKALNPAWGKTLGYTQEEFLARPRIEFVHPEDREAAVALVRRLQVTGENVVAFENRYQCKDGSYRWLSWDATPNLDEGLFYAVVRDVTQKKESERTLYLQSAALDAAIDGVVITDRDGHIEWVNPAFSKLTGYTSEDVFGQNLRFLKSGYQERQFYANLWDTILAGQVWSGEMVNKRKDGVLYTEEMTITPVRDANDQISHFIAIKRDVTARKQAEQAHDMSEARYRALFENSVVSLWEEDFSQVKSYLDALREAGVTDFRAYFEAHPDAVNNCISLVKILDVNQATLRLLEANDKETLLAGLEVVFGEQSRDVFKEQLVALAEGARQFESEAIHYTLTGRPLWVRVYVALMDEETWLRVSVSITDYTRRKRAEDDLRAARHFAQNTVNSLSAHIAIVDQEGIIIAVNDAWRNFARANGVEPEKVSEGVNYFAASQVTGNNKDAQTAAAFLAGLRAVLDGETDSFSLEYPCHAPNERRWFEGRITPFKGNGLGRAVVAHENITGRVQAELSLAAKNDELTAINRIIGLATSTLQVESVLEIVCTEASRLFKIPAASGLLVNDKIAELVWWSTDADLKLRFALESIPAFEYVEKSKVPLVIHDAPNNPLLGEVREVIAAYDTQTVICTPLFVGGSVRGLVCLYSKEDVSLSDEELSLFGQIGNAASQALGNSLLHQQISTNNIQLSQLVDERTKQLQRLNERMAAILNNASEAIVLITADGSIQTANRAFNEQFGYQPDELYDQPLTVIADQLFHQQLRSAIAAVNSTQEMQRFQMIGRHETGAECDIEISLTGVPNNEHHIVCTIHDISHLKAVERMKDRFISTVNHELRNPIAGVILGSEILENHYDRMSDEQRLDKIGQIRRQSEVLAELVDAVLNIARLEARQGKPGLDPVDMGLVVKEVVAELRLEANRKYQQLELPLEIPSIVLMGEYTDFSRIWRNLIANAIKYTPEGGRISVRLDIVTKHADDDRESSETTPYDDRSRLLDLPSGNYLVGQVEDNGHGIGPEDLKYLFTRFYRGWAKHSQIPGTGLGLALVHELLTTYGGDIRVKSELEVGSTFTFWLPIRRQGDIDHD